MDKHFRLERERYFAEIKSIKIRPKYSAREAKEALIAEGFVIDGENAAAVNFLCLYFSGDTRFESGTTSLTKGIFLVGPVGVGKTRLMRFFMDNPHQSFGMPSCTDIENKWTNNGAKEPFTINDIGIIEYYSSVQKAPKSDPYLHEFRGICFDDLGTRDNPVQKRYGEEKNVMQEIILNRYRSVPFNQTHFTSNLGADGTEQKYGTRIRDRIREMCNVIEIGGKSRRK